MCEAVNISITYEIQSRIYKCGALFDTDVGALNLYFLSLLIFRYLAMSFSECKILLAYSINFFAKCESDATVEVERCRTVGYTTPTSDLCSHG